MIDIFINSLIAALFFLVIIGTRLSYPSQVNLVFPPFFLQLNLMEPNGNKHLSELF